MNIFEKFSLKNRVSIVTGAVTGLGKAMATAMAEAGSNIVIADVNTTKTEKAVKELEEKGVRVLALEMDVTDEKQIGVMVKHVIQEFGKIDVLVNNAGIAMHEKAEDMKTDNWRGLSTSIKWDVFCIKSCWKSYD